MAAKKIAVYTIVKNGEAQLHDWYESAKDADYLYMGDTGSTDDTIKVARGLGIRTYRIVPDEPFHFGNARNAILKKLPADVDICLSLDSDEVLPIGWRKIVESEYTGPIMNVQWLDLGVVTYQTRLHDRKGVEWYGRIHEVPRPNKSYNAGHSSLLIQHNRDRSKDRDFYIELLKTAIDDPAEHKNMPRNISLLAREYLVRNNVEDAMPLLERYFELPNTYAPERADLANRTYWINKDPRWLYMSILAYPKQQSAYLSLAVRAAENEDWIGAYYNIKMAQEYGQMVYYDDRVLTSEAISAILGEAAFQTGRVAEAIELATDLVADYPENDGHKANLARYHGE